MDSRKASIFSALAASSCCLPPLILLGLTLVGVGTAGLAGLSSTLGELKIYLLPLAVLGLGLSYLLYFRERRKCAGDTCAMPHRGLTRLMLTLSTVVVLGFTAWSVYPYVRGTGGGPSAGRMAGPGFAAFRVEGMTCGGCEVAVNGAIRAALEVDSVQSSFTEGKAFVWTGDGPVDTAAVLEAIARVGYRAAPLADTTERE